MKQILSVFLFAFFCVLANAQSPAYYNEKGVAIKGYDVVAYFTDHTPVEGSKNFSYNWEGTEWHFKNQANLDAFKANPVTYAPEFGGYCAYGVSENHKAPTDPAAFTIVDNKLYLNYSPEVKKLWIKDTKGRIKKAEENWQKLKGSN